MAGLIDTGATSITLDEVNEILMMGTASPVRSLANLPMESDAGLAYNTLNTTMRRVAATGWWFNTDRRVSHSPDGAGLITVAGISARASRPRPGELQPPEVRLEVSAGSTTGKLRNLDDDTYVFTRDILLDVLRHLSADNMPPVFRDYCVLRAGRKFAGFMGLQVDPSDEQQAKQDLELAESDNQERSNLLVTDSRTLSIWTR